MKVVCIDNLYVPLTKFKVYEANDENDVYLITLDNGLLKPFYRSRFLTIEEYRQSQINDILE